MPFKIKDLMIDVLPEADIQRLKLCPIRTCLAQSRICPGFTCEGGSIYCFDGSDFPWRDRLTPIIFEKTSPVIYQRITPEELANLKVELKQALAQVEARERTVAAQMKPQTLEEAELLEGKLTDALKEISNLKQILSRKAEKSS